MYPHVLELEALFEDNGVRSGVITNSVALGRVLYEQRDLPQPSPSALQSVNRREGVHLSHDLAVTFACPACTGVFALQFLDLTHVWSNRDSSIIETSCICHRSNCTRTASPNHLQLSQRYLLDGNLTMLQYSTMLTPSSKPCAEFRMRAWVDIFRQRFTLQQLQGSHPTSSNRQIFLTPSLSLRIRLPQPTFGMSQSVSRPQPDRHGCLVGQIRPTLSS